MADLTDNDSGSDIIGGGMSVPSQSAPRAPRPHGGGGGGYADEIHSVTIRARQRTFYLDLKQSSHGKFFKLSEKSRGGRKTTIMFDVEDLPEMIKAFQEMQTKV